MTTEPLLLVACPDVDCGAVAEIVDQFYLYSTDGDLAHAKTWCVRRHVFTVLVETLVPLDLPTRERAPRSV